MTTVKRLTRLALLIALGMLSTAPLNVEAGNIQRGCTALYQIYIVRAVTASNLQLVGINKWWVLGSRSEDYQFTARRGCGSTMPNRCRRRAGAAALQCMQAHTQSLDNTPAACRSNGIQGYRVGNFSTLLQQSVCRFMAERSGVARSILPKPYYVDTTVRAYIYGGPGCGGADHRKMKRDLRNVRVRCPAGQ